MLSNKDFEELQHHFKNQFGLGDRKYYDFEALLTNAKSWFRKRNPTLSMGQKEALHALYKQHKLSIVVEMLKTQTSRYPIDVMLESLSKEDIAEDHFELPEFMQIYSAVMDAELIGTKSAVSLAAMRAAQQVIAARSTS